jgi:hypothetical protein
MQLLKVDSISAKKKIGYLASDFLGSSPKAVVFVDGRQGKKCLTYNGQVKPKYELCQATHHFLCEFNETGNFLTDF